MITKHKLAERIKKMREDRELSQEELASKLGVPRPSISQIESGQRDISSIELAKLAKMFEISVDDLKRFSDLIWFIFCPPIYLYVTTVVSNCQLARYSKSYQKKNR